MPRARELAWHARLFFREPKSLESGSMQRRTVISLGTGLCVGMALGGARASQELGLQAFTENLPP